MNLFINLGICLIILIIVLIIVIISLTRYADKDISYEIATACFFLSPSIVFLVLVILEVINK
jgi:hypothetical protein